VIVTSKISQISSENIAVTIVTFEEQLKGRLHFIQKANTKDSLVKAYARLKLTLDYFAITNIVEFNPSAYDIFTDLRQQKIRIGIQDLRIASIALSVRGIVVTRNRKDFAQVPNLLLEDWSIE
jgi:tRNA(fMet)-specific endonuclease VapC